VVPDFQAPVLAERFGQAAQVRHLLTAVEPARHVEMNERHGSSGVAVQSGGDPDLAVCRGDGAVQSELAQGARYSQDEQCLGFFRAQGAEREAVAVQELAAAAWP